MERPTSSGRRYIMQRGGDCMMVERRSLVQRRREDRRLTTVPPGQSPNGEAFPAVVSRENGDGQKISVVITTRNRANLLRKAIESVLPSPLICSPEQVIVVDDDSSDETGDVARQFGVRYVRIADHNTSRARNAGLALAQTPYVTFLDDDDAWLPGNMEAQLSALETHPAAAFAYGIAQCATEDLEPIVEPFPLQFPTPPLPSGRVPEALHLCGYPQLGVVLFRQTALAAVGGSDPRIRYHQDGDLMLRIAGHHEIVGVEVVGMLHRLRPPSKARSDYHWARARREVTRWRPRDVGVGWKTATRFRIETRGLFHWHFYEDAEACLGLGQRRDALICLWRALWVSPAHALRHYRAFGSKVMQCIHETQSPQQTIASMQVQRARE
jgi:glycosyltransferase involved in cell wall biosynthesis